MDELDPLHKVELAMLRAEYQKRYQTMVAYLKEQIGEGTEVVVITGLPILGVIEN